MSEINIDNLASEIANTLTKYGQNVQKGINVSSNKIAKKVVKTLKQKSPEKTGGYKNGWTSNKEQEFLTNTNHIVYNKTDYQLTHLLENGHAKANGGRTAGRPHIRPAEELAKLEFIQEVEEVIRNAAADSI